MKNRTSFFLHLIFVAIVIIELTGRLTDNTNLEYLVKPIILLYAISLIAMSMMALNRNGRVNRASFLLVFVGSGLFVIADSMIAFNKFLMEFSQAGFWIMVTYIAAQYLIMRGLILEK